MEGGNRRLKTLLTAKLAEVEHSGLYRRLRSVSGAQDATVMLDGHEVLLLSSNNYLGLANQPALKSAAQEAIEHYGCGAGASRLISGSMVLHQNSNAGSRLSRTPRPRLFSPLGIMPTSASSPPS